MQYTGGRGDEQIKLSRKGVYINTENNESPSRNIRFCFFRPLITRANAVLISLSEDNINNLRLFYSRIISVSSIVWHSATYKS